MKALYSLLIPKLKRSIKWICDNQVNNLLDLVFPVECIYCGEEGVWICDNCYPFLEFRDHHNCLNCHAPKTPSGLCSQCRPRYHLDKIIMAGDYKEEKINKAIKLLKYRFIRDLSPYLGDYLSSFLRHSEESFFVKKGTLVVPIPLHWRRYNWRGFNQANLIAMRLAQNLDLSISKKLQRIRYKKPQTKLKKLERQKNIKNSFVWKGASLNKKDVVLVDDVVTTGATMDEAARVLKQNGARKIIGLAVASE